MCTINDDDDWSILLDQSSRSCWTSLNPPLSKVIKHFPIFLTPKASEVYMDAYMDASKGERGKFPLTGLDLPLTDWSFGFLG